MILYISPQDLRDLHDDKKMSKLLFLRKEKDYVNTEKIVLIQEVEDDNEFTE